MNNDTLAQIGEGRLRIDNHASYVDHWLKILKGDSSAIIKAAAKAEQAVTWLHNAAAGGAPGIDQPEALAA